MKGLDGIITALKERKEGIKGICRGLTFVFAASLTSLLLKPEAGWYIATMGGLVGFFAYFGWQKD